MKKANRTILTAALLVIAVPLLLWLDVWLAIKFGNWCESMGANFEGAISGGVFAWIVLVAAQAVATATYAFSKENN